MITSTAPLFCSKSLSYQTCSAREGQTSPTLLWKLKKYPGFGKKVLILVHPEIVSEYLRQKVPKFSTAGLFLLIFWGNVYRSDLISRNPHCPENFLVLHLHIYDLSNLVFVHWNCIDRTYSILTVSWWSSGMRPEKVTWVLLPVRIDRVIPAKFIKSMSSQKF